MKPPALLSALLVWLCCFSIPNDLKAQIGVQQKAPVFPTYNIYRSNTIHSRDNTATLTTGLDNDLYFSDSIGSIIHFYVRTHFTDTGNFRRLPLNISIVIDKSGSMEGVKMGNAKRAAKAIIDELTPEDIVSIVAFDNYIDTILSPTHILDKEALKKRISTIVPMGGTNLWGGMSKGYSFVTRNAQKNRVNRVLLLSDGGANIGITDPEQIKDSVNTFKQSGITTSSFGIGLDFNERLLTEMAAIGGGNFYYIDQPQQITTALSKELNRISKVSAKDALLTIQVPQSLQVAEPLPFMMHREGQSIFIKWGEVFAGDKRELLLTLSYIRKTTTPINLNTELRYSNEGKQSTLSNTLTLSPIRQKATYVTHFDKEVIEKTIFFTASASLETALNRTDEGKADEATYLLKANTDYLKRQIFYTNSNQRLQQLDSLNLSYLKQLETLDKASPDSLKKLQKTVRTANYQLANQIP